MLKYTIKYHSR